MLLPLLVGRLCISWVDKAVSVPIIEECFLTLDSLSSSHIYQLPDYVVGQLVANTKIRGTSNSAGVKRETR